MSTLSREATLLLLFLLPFLVGVNYYREEFAPLQANSYNEELILFGRDSSLRESKVEGSKVVPLCIEDRK